MLSAKFSFFSLQKAGQYLVSCLPPTSIFTHYILQKLLWNLQFVKFSHSKFYRIVENFGICIA